MMATLLTARDTSSSERIWPPSWDGRLGALTLPLLLTCRVAPVVPGAPPRPAAFKPLTTRIFFRADPHPPPDRCAQADTGVTYPTMLFSQEDASVARTRATPCSVPTPRRSAGRPP